MNNEQSWRCLKHLLMVSCMIQKSGASSTVQVAFSLLTHQQPMLMKILQLPKPYQQHVQHQCNLHLLHLHKRQPQLHQVTLVQQQSQA